MKTTHESSNIAIIWSGTITGLKNTMLKDIQLFQNIGHDDVQGVIEQIDFANVSAVIGAPGIAAEIRRLVPVPVIIAYPQYIDVLETIKSVEVARHFHNRKIALVLHADNFIQVERINYFINNTVDLFSYRVKTQMRSIVETIQEQRYELIIGGPTAVRMAHSCHMEAVELTYGEEALLNAVDKAREILFLMEKEGHSLNRLKAVLNVIPDAVIETDENGTVGMCNRQALHMLSLHTAEVIGQNVCELLSEPSWEQVYLTGAPQMDVLCSYKGQKYFSTRQPIFEGSHIAGSVGTLQKANKIQLLDSKYRARKNSGLVATYTFRDIIHKSPVMKNIIEQAELYANSDSTILIEGETGTGKELFAQSIHNASPRSKGPFVALNCAALTETLLESELMGYDEGAFSGAKRGGKIGLFERADKGTIFLDEISELPLQLQAKILRVIQEKCVMHLGGDSIIPVDVRVITATNVNLLQLIEAGSFRRDLYYRINVLSLLLPPLRERSEDISALISHFVRRHPAAVEEGLSPDSLAEFVKGYGWPGNIRELHNFVERLLVTGPKGMHSQETFFHELGRASQLQESAGRQPATYGETLQIQVDTLENMESELIRHIVARCGGNKSKAALLLDISRNTVHQRMR